MQKLIPLYNADGQLIDKISEQRLAKMQRAGVIARVVRHAKGHVNRAFRRRRPGEGRGIQIRDYQGTRYSFEERLDCGKKAWRLKKLGKGDELRPIFLQVVTDCQVVGGYEERLSQRVADIGCAPGGGVIQ